MQGLNLSLPEGDALLREFDFIPHARLDDLMVSYAVDGAGVGPHFDNYDVFLLQGMGKRHWHISKQKDLRLRDDVPLKILSHFKSEQDWVLEPGDMLYLPPQYAHDGIAVGDCMTWSIGFRAPPAQELMEGFLSYLQERTFLPGRYADPDLKLQKHPGEIGNAMIDQVADMLAEIKWNRRHRARLSRHLSDRAQAACLLRPARTAPELRSLRCSGEEKRRAPGPENPAIVCRKSLLHQW